jgi:5-methylcytosine-specific restriction protein A
MGRVFPVPHRVRPVPTRPAVYRPTAQPRPILSDCRPTSTQRGYGSRWQRFRLWFLMRHPLCVQCQAEGRLTPATDVDHVTPTQGRHDSAHYDPDALQALCHAHHSAKTGKDRAQGLTRTH